MNPETLASSHAQKMPDVKFYNRIIRLLSIGMRSVSKTIMEGEQNIPYTGKAILVPNHVSHVDPVILGVAVARVRPICALAKESLFRAPIAGTVLARMGHIPVHRGTATAGASLTAAVEAINQDRLVAVYPEGTVPRNSPRLGKGKTGAARLALATGAPVIPLGQWGAQDIIPAGAKPLSSILKSLFNRHTVRIQVGAPVVWSQWDGVPIPDMSSQPRELVRSMTDDIMQAISEQLTILGK